MRIDAYQEEEQDIGTSVDQVYDHILRELVEACDIIDVEHAVDSKHVAVLHALAGHDDFREKLMPQGPSAIDICAHLDVHTMGTLKDKRESAGICVTSFDPPFSRIFKEEATVALSDIADCGRNFVHGLCTGRYGIVHTCHRCETGQTPWRSCARPRASVKDIPWKEVLKGVCLEVCDDTHLPLQSPEAEEVVINSSLPVQNAHNVSQAIYQKLKDVHCMHVTLSSRSKNNSVRLCRRRYRSKTVWAVSRSDVQNLWSMLNVKQHRTLPERRLPQVIDLCSDSEEEEC